jgi:hypothetical protein
VTAPASWVPETDRRRLAAYTVLATYDSNQAAALLGQDGDDRREYGDASLIVDGVVVPAQLVIRGSTAPPRS